MIIAGPCLYVDDSDTESIIKTARSLEGIADLFRVKFWGGGTSVEKYFRGIGEAGLKNLVNAGIMNIGTEVQSENQLAFCIMHELTFIWVGARNCQNYALLETLKYFPGTVMIKRGPGVTYEEICNLYDIMVKMHCKQPYIIERGVNTFDRTAENRWTPDLLTAIKIKKNRPDIYERYVIDCSHSAGKKEYVEEIYRAFKALDVNHYMFECTHDGQSRTDKGHMLSTTELKEILK